MDPSIQNTVGGCVFDDYFLTFSFGGVGAIFYIVIPYIHSQKRVKTGQNLGK